MVKVVNFHDGEDDNIYVETDDCLMYFMPIEQWETVEVPDSAALNPIAKATYLLHYHDCFTCMGDDN